VERFTASNGITVFVRDGGTVQFQHGTREKSSGILQIFPHSEWWQTLREFFRAEEDERLGRWRWPENPDYIVYPSDQVRLGEAFGWIRVIHEPTAFDEMCNRHTEFDGSRAGFQFADAARAFFDAHPEPKPAWHDAVEGEVWILLFPNSAHAWFVNGNYFQSTKTLTNIAKADPGITAARRIYPEDAS
jgi:hypothetical protein